MRFDIYFDPDTHIYLVDGQEVPSVTSILEPLHRSYGKVNPAVLEYAANRGKAVHEACELIDYGLEPEVYPEIEGYVRAYLDFLQVYRPNWTHVEHIVYHDYGKYIGTLDRAGYLNGTEFAIVDIKTSQPTKEALVSVCLQTEAYAHAYALQESAREYNQRAIVGGFETGMQIDRYGVFLKADGTYRVVNCDEYETKYGIDVANAWADLLAVHHLVDRLLATKEKK